MLRSSVVVFCLFLVTACSKGIHPAADFAFNLAAIGIDGSWRLSQILCNGSPTTHPIFSSEDLFTSENIQLRVDINGNVGNREWTFGTCVLGNEINPIEYPSSSQANMTIQPTSCSADCDPSMCDTPTYTTSVPYEVIDGEWYADVTQEINDGYAPSPCGSEQDADKIQLVFRRL